MGTKKLTKSASKPNSAKPKAKLAPQKTIKSAAKPAVKTASTSRTAKSANSAAKATSPVKSAPSPVAPSSTTPRPNSKQSQLLNLLRTGGATIPQMSELTGWQAHTIRATLSAVFRKRLGLTVESSLVAGSTGRLYRITGQVPA
jgi:hypothetical protein